jgi:outer membrane protein assembly factor BamB
MEGTFDENTFTKRWESLDTLASQYCTPILIGPHAYCIDGRDDMPPTSMKCIDTHTGIVRWNQDNFGYGTLIYADEKIIAAKTNGELVLMEANPQHFNILGQHRALSGTLRALPALADGKLFLRDDATLVCLNVGR